MPKITQLDVSAYTIPTDFPEADGTFEWDSTTIVIVEVHAGGRTGGAVRRPLGGGGSA